MLTLLFAPDADEAAVLTLILQRAGFEVRLVTELDQLSQGDRPAELFFFAFTTEKAITSEFISQLRLENQAPIVLLMEARDESAQIDFIEAGADLVFSRPYSPKFMVAQLRALMRRSSGLPYFSLPALSQAGITLDPSKRSVQVGKEAATRLTQLEFRLLYALMTHPGRIIPSENLVEYVWGYGGEGSQGLVRGLISRLRGKIEPDPSNPRYIMTDAGIGYYFEPEPDQQRMFSKTEKSTSEVR
ncbi:MAG: response regulator transcription factor [Anaerolineales bacterium]|nr:MAG: response regulator transcription factor [Anaerolineales bacterium]